MLTVVLLLVSNTFMTFAWYGHLKHRSAPIVAAVLVSYGFRREIKPLRLAGLAVAGLAVVKVVFFDLSSLDALYRVGSVFFLGLVTLSLAYLYYRHDRSERTS